VLSEATFKALRTQVPAVALGAQQVKGREAPVFAYKIYRMGGR
jgi:hypothetical protein